MGEPEVLLARKLAEFPFAPTPQSVVERAVELLELGPGDTLADLGCGDGRVLEEAARAGAFAVGFEINPLLVRIAARRLKSSGTSALADVVMADAFSVDLARFTAVYAYPSPSVCRRLAIKIRGCRPGCRIAVHMYPLEGIEPESVEEVDVGGRVHRLYVYRVKSDRGSSIIRQHRSHSSPSCD